ncbi:hypothetical protein ACK3TF_001951 [Chlorella vulgaris]
MYIFTSKEHVVQDGPLNRRSIAGGHGSTMASPRVTVTDLMPEGEGVAHDAEYQKMVQDVTDSQSGVKGWLFAAGAFDKGDQLYLKSEEERLRFVEQELEENERRAFLLQRARLEEEAEARMAAAAARATAAAKLRQAEADRKKRHPIAMVRVRPAAPQGTAGTLQEEENAAKKQRLGSGVAETGSQQQQGKEAEQEPNRKEDEEDSDGSEGGLGGLLGGYGSGSESEEEAGQAAAAAAAAGSKVVSSNNDGQHG